MGCRGYQGKAPCGLSVPRQAMLPHDPRVSWGQREGSSPQGIPLAGQASPYP